MKSHWIVLIAMLGVLSGYRASATAPNFYAGFRNVPASVKLYHYKVPDKALRAKFAAAKKKAMEAVKHGNGGASGSFTFMVLPKLYLFDQKGREIYASSGTPKDLVAALNHAFVSPTPDPGAKSLEARLDGLVPVGKSSALAPGATNKFTLLQYWAPWCTYCFTERDELLAYFRDHKNLRIDWITIDADIAKAAGFKVPPHSSNQRASE
ncbi:MAG: thioredoxin family protein [Gammaproteobacteria bacterium]|nr:thioredoxin family protein [Gammaproteobacteria bacterium]